MLLEHGAAYVVQVKLITFHVCVGLRQRELLQKRITQIIRRHIFYVIRNKKMSGHEICARHAIIIRFGK